MKNKKFAKQFLSSVILILLSTYVSHAQNWYEANNPFGGNVLAMHETNDGALLCGTTRGLFKSTDNGENWEAISGEYENLPVLDVKSTPSGMYISLFSYFLRRSYDEGLNWETIPAQDWTSLSDIVVNDAGLIFLNTNNSVWRSSDNGDTWTQLTVDVNVNLLRKLEISPDGELFAGTYNKKIYRSGDNGDTWIELFSTDGDIITFGFDGDNTVYAGTLFLGLYKSSDNGDNWSTIPSPPGADGALDIITNSSGDVYVAAFEDDVFKSLDGGMSWEDITFNLIDPSVRILFLNSDDELFAGTMAAGVNMLEGSSWDPKNQGINAIFIERFISIEGDIYACTDYGVFISEDNGQSWQQSLKGMVDTEILALAKAPNGDLYAGGEMLYFSEDGINWNNISQGFPDEEVYATDILVEPDGRVILATDEYGIRFTENQGQTWTNANTGLEDVTMAFIRQSPEGYFFTADGYNLYRSNDLSGGWEIINDGLADTDITEFTVGNAALFAITYSDGLFKSTNNGDSWALAIDEDFRNVAVNGNEVYGSSGSVSTGGVYYSDDNGVNWSNIADGLPSVQIEEVGYVQDLGLFANVDDFGLYTLDFSVNGIDELVFNEGRLKGYPNPFMESATLELELDENSKVSYTILNMHGQIVDHSYLLNLAKGTHNIRLGKGLLPGIYLVAVDINNSTRTIRLIKTQ